MTRMLVCAAILSLGVDSASGQANQSGPRHVTTHAEIERLLDQERDMVFNDATLESLAAFLIASGIPTYIDIQALEDYGLSTDMPLTFRQPAIRLRDGLSLALRSFDLSWTVRRGRLVITTREEEEIQLITRVYDVRNLVEFVPVPLWGGGFAIGPPTIAYQCDFESLILTITDNVKPDSWAVVGGPGDIQPYYTRHMRVIVVSQTYEVHRQIQALLSELAEHGGSTPLPHPPAHPAPPRQLSTYLGSPASHPFPRGVSIRSSQLRTTGQ